jgi:alkylated DNA repair dioxygenase AlkB
MSNIISRTELTQDSWLDDLKLPQTLTSYFNILWNMHPVEYGKVKIYGKVLNTPRWQQTYGHEYKFSGINHEALPIPEEFYPYMTWVNSLDYGEYNQMLVNWYENGLHYIGKHSDDENNMEKGSPIISISLGATRKFRLRKKSEKGIFKDISMTDGLVLVMGGAFQTELTHEVPKIIGEKGNNVGKRINITFRQFKK